MITIVDYGMGNLGSVFNMFKKIGVASKITSDLEDIKTATKNKWQQSKEAVKEDTHSDHSGHIGIEADASIQKK